MSSISGETPFQARELRPLLGATSKVSVRQTVEVSQKINSFVNANYRANSQVGEISAPTMQFVDIKPSPGRDGFCLFFGSAPPAWFEQEHSAIGYAQEVFPTHTIRVFASGHVIVRVIPPVE
jgi:hypothetical protein